MQSSIKQTQSYQNKVIKQLERLPDNPIKKFTDFEDEMIKKYYPKKGGSGLAKVFNKTALCIANRACHLGIKRIK